jgi:cation diffusion facilitator CzcD-associated flavoprotein CzcO
METKKLPVAIIGAGPIGLAAAAHLVLRGEKPIVFESGPEVGSSIRAWGHVRLFSPWQYNIDKASVELLTANGWQSPSPDDLPTGNDIIDRYLQPLASLPALRRHIHLGTRVTGIGRRGLDKMKNTGRDEEPFVVHVVSDEWGEMTYEVRAVIDASGTWKNPNPIGSGGIPVPGERDLVHRIHYGMPDVLGSARNRYAGRRVAVIGSGHSATNSLLELEELQRQEPDTTITWIMRKQKAESAYGGQESDSLAARGELGVRLRGMVEAGRLHIVSSFRANRLERSPDGIVIRGIWNSAEIGLPEVDEIIVATGARPDLSFLREIRLNLDPAVESASVLAPMIDPNFHSCGTVRPHGARELRHDEKDFYIVGMKSYGRAPTFLLATGYEQVRSVVAELTGDHAAAEAVELELPETGVCNVGTAHCCAADTALREAAAPGEPVASCCTVDLAPRIANGVVEQVPTVSSSSCCG